MNARIAIIALAALLAVVATFVQLDRQSRISPTAAAFVPERLGANATRVEAQAAMAAGDAERALSLSRQQVRLRPMPAESLTLLSQAAAGAGERSLALEALGVASSRGWREPVSQLASGESAIAQGAYTVAAQRVVALLASGKLREPALDLLARLVARPEGRDAFADRLAAFGRWQTDAISAAGGVARPLDWAATLALAQERGADLDCDRLQRLAATYRRRGEDGAADLVLSGDCVAN